MKTPRAIILVPTTWPPAVSIGALTPRSDRMSTIPALGVHQNNRTESVPISPLKPTTIRHR